eukprot:scaffold265857_cov39-Prasinocladus_malaysianus.AAC.1
MSELMTDSPCTTPSLQCPLQLFCRITLSAQTVTVPLDWYSAHAGVSASLQFHDVGTFPTTMLYNQT